MTASKKKELKYETIDSKTHTHSFTMTHVTGGLAVFHLVFAYRQRVAEVLICMRLRATQRQKSKSFLCNRKSKEEAQEREVKIEKKKT